ncbi:MAG TPA: phosphoribosyltransferase [Candidatus Baltobacteraceae bacterium]|nr:phosphoribosyltransferase [Candidatus Baltobacteraceae bacterium]
MAYAYSDRRAAGRALARALESYRGRPGLAVLALPRGGVPVAYEVARALHAPLDVFAVRKLGVPGHEELAMGAVASGGIFVLDTRLAEMLGVQPAQIDRIKQRELDELHRRESAYRDTRPALQLQGKTVIVIDDGLATGSSMHAAVEALRQSAPARIIVAVPVGAAGTCERLRTLADDVLCVLSPAQFHAVGAHYVDFRQTSDEEVRELLQAAAADLQRWTAA